MEQVKSKWIFIGKVLLAATAISALITYAARNGGSTMPVWLLMVVALSVLLIGFGFLALLTIPTAEFEQWKLRMGAKDTKWMFFNQDPPGFESEKAQYLKNKK
jgi:hypothetical protein